MGKTRDLFKKIKDTKGIFHAKMGSIKDRNGMDLTEAEDIKKSWQEYTEKLYKKNLHDPDNHDGVITHLEPDILECEVKWALESITTNKASGGDGIPVEIFQVLKDDAVKRRVGFLLWKNDRQNSHKDGQGSSLDALALYRLCRVSRGMLCDSYELGRNRTVHLLLYCVHTS